MNLTYEMLFNGLSLIICKLYHNAKIEIKEDKANYNILIYSTEIAYSRCSNEEFEEIVNFLHYKNKEKVRLFDVVCFVSREKKDKDDFNEFQNNKYKLSFSKELVIFIQDLFYNLKEIYYDTEDKELIFSFLNKAFDDKKLPILKGKFGYRIDEEVFCEKEEKEAILFDRLLSKNLETKKEIKDNVEKYYDLIPNNYEDEHNLLLKIKNFKKDSNEYRKQSSIKGGKNRFKNKEIEDFDKSKKQDREFLAVFLKEKLFRYMYWSECFKGIKSPRKKAETIYYTLVLLQEIRHQTNRTENSEKLLSEMQSFIRMYKLSKKLSKSLINEVYEEIKKDKRLLYRRILTMISKYYKVNLMYIDDSMDYVKNDEDQFRQFYKMCLKIDKEMKQNDI